MKYRVDGSWATSGVVKRYFRKTGYSNVDKKNSYKLSYITDMLNKRLPVFIAGGRGGGNRHAWVIDGSMTQRRSVQKMVNSAPSGSPTTEERFLLHCNFGWGGVADGYYFSDLFDPGKGPVATDPNVDLSTPGTAAGHYKNDMKVIKYSR